MRRCSEADFSSPVPLHHLREFVFVQIWAQTTQRRSLTNEFSVCSLTQTQTQQPI